LLTVCSKRNPSFLKLAIMNFQAMNKQRKFVLISSAIGFISMFLPWISVSLFGYSQNLNGMHDKGILVFLCFVACGLIAFLGDQTKNIPNTSWAITLVAGALALLLTIWFYSEAVNSIMGTSLVGIGVYIAAIAALGILFSAYRYRLPADNLKDAFNNMKKTVESKMSTTTNTSVTTTPPPAFNGPEPPLNPPLENDPVS
jgi:peptidoglycan/LPS O-acetylase OafA/YrhL